MRAAFLIPVLLFLYPQSTVAQVATYLGSDACTDCHEQSVLDWSGSHHALAWTEATAQNIVADFDGTVFSHDGMTARFRIAGDGTYHVDVQEKDGSHTSYKVHSVAGIEPLQQYLLETEPGRLQSFDVVWDTEEERWFHLYPDQDLPPSDGLHWTGPYKNWNGRCAQCHATGFRKNYDAGSRSYGSVQVEIGVGCEACHGPGSTHVEWARARATTKTAPPENHGFSVDFSDPDQTLGQCAGCHSRREAHLDGNPLPGMPFDDAYSLSLLRPGLYHADGQILDEVYVYGSFLQSRMYQRGVTCLNCHDAHSARPVAEGNALCTQCHNPEGNPDYPTLKPALYDDADHHRHPDASPGADCKACHMVEQVYMGNDWRADHSFRIPRPDLSEATGSPDACTTCHTDRTPDWAADRIANWFPDSSRRNAHFGVALARGREDAVRAADDLARLAADSDQPALVRATALWLLEQSNSATTAGELADLTRDPDPLVRAAAAGLQQLAPPADRAARLADALADPSRSVRMSAARSMLDTLSSPPPEEIRPALQSALSEWRSALRTRLDFPETHLQIAGLALTMRDMASASSAFREVVRLDPQRTDAWMMLTRIAAATQGPGAALRVVDEALVPNPDDPGLLAARAELSGQDPSGNRLLPPD